MKLLPVFILLALCITCTTIVGALEPDAISHTPPNSSETSFDVDTYQIPELKFDSTQQPIIITDELKPTQQPKSSARNLDTPTEPSDIPYGSIVYHSSNNGILTTTAFDSKGTQIFTTTDNTAALVTTPQGEKPATAVHEIPSGSVVYERNGNTYVTYNNSVILALIYNQTTTNTTNTIPRIDTGSVPTPPSKTGWNTLGNFLGWITYTEDTVTNGLDIFTADWNAPTTTPENTIAREALAIFIGIEHDGTPKTDGIIQPVLMWNFCKTNSTPKDPGPHKEYSAAAWDFHTIPVNTANYDQLLHSTPIVISPGTIVHGTIEKPPLSNTWTVSIEEKNDKTKKTYFSTSRYPSSLKWKLHIVTEATGAGIKNLSNSLPRGTISFTNIYAGRLATRIDLPYEPYIHPEASNKISKFKIDIMKTCNGNGCSPTTVNGVNIYFTR